MCARRGQGKVFGVREPQRASSVAAEAWRCARLKFARSRQYLDAGQARFVGGPFGGAHNLHQRRHAASIGGVHVRIVLEQECHVRHDAVRASDVQRCGATLSACVCVCTALEQRAHQPRLADKVACSRLDGSSQILLAQGPGREHEQMRRLSGGLLIGRRGEGVRQIEVAPANEMICPVLDVAPA